MRYSKDHKAETRRKILNAAARLFREFGYDGVGVDAIMNEVGLTAGGFYAHFDSKETLFAEAMGTALDESNLLLAAKRPGITGMDALRNVVYSYLSRTHRDMVSAGCPLPAVTPDVARSSDATRECYEQRLRHYLSEIEGLLPEGASPARDRALALVAQCVGGLMLSRAVKDENFSNQILKACRQAAMKIGEQ
ncbi:MAG TPA: TetR/AcrR family transcriptional regulator [Blastocatellia bacterium]|nr:TetR/AcrR family transcriptional regulator [Blastocatellia bacterium]